MEKTEVLTAMSELELYDHRRSSSRNVPWVICFTKRFEKPVRFA